MESVLQLDKSVTENKMDTTHFEGKQNGCPNNQLQGEYTPEDDYGIINYVLKNKASDRVQCEVLWTNMQLEFSQHTCHSLKSRYLEHIIPKLHTYYIPQHIYKLLKKGYQKPVKQRIVSNGDQEMVSVGESLQLKKLRSCLVGKLNSQSPQNTAVVRIPDDLRCSDSTNEFIIPDQKKPLQDLDRLRSKLCDKLSSCNDASKLVKFEDVKCASLPSKDVEPVLEINCASEHKENKPLLVKSSVLVNEDVLYLRRLQKTLVEKLNTGTVPNISVPVNLETRLLKHTEESGIDDDQNTFREQAARQEQANILERLQASIRDKMQNEIWVDNLVALVSSLPENNRKTILDRVKQKLSISESQYSRDSSEVQERNVNKFTHNVDHVDIKASTDTIEAKDVRSEQTFFGATAISDQDMRPSCSPSKHKLAAKAAESFCVKQKYGQLFFCYDCNFTSKIKEQIESHDCKPHAISSNGCQKISTEEKDLDVHAKCYPELRNFTCAFCDYHISDKAELLKHMTKHMERTKVTCQFCGKFFASGRSLLNHVKNTHVESNVAHCSLCSFRSSSVMGLCQHQVIKHNLRKSFKCPICKDTISQRASFMLHMKKHTEKFQCGSCKEVFSTRAILEDHKQVSPDKYRCDICNRTLDSRCHLRTHETAHKIAHNILNKFYCSYCTFSFASRASLTRHYNTIHRRNVDLSKRSCSNINSRVSNNHRKSSICSRANS